ncbi:hypothetical protein EDB85DRAFT_2149427 [Lactarius pseudohatsudake]|nr:hypothetical protein EDB85DRAFT_2149427 [Lactarius pseudohatsudake]
MSPSLSSILPEDEPDDESSVLSQCWPSDEKFRSRWSCSTLATLATRAAASPPTSPSPSARLHFHLGSVGFSDTLFLYSYICIHIATDYV